ncbi:MAG: glutaminase A [Bacillota bacterium]
MKKIITESIVRESLNNSKSKYKYGKVASYIPALAEAKEDEAAAVAVTPKGKVYRVGDWQVGFTIQSISKPLTLALAILDLGRDEVFAKVGVEPTGEEFNSISKLIGHPKPYNPMVNAGAITITSLIKGKNLEEKFTRILNFYRKICCNPKLEIDEEVFLSEQRTGHRNRSLAYFLKDNRIIEGKVEDILDLYFLQCSVKVNTEDIARAASVLAYEGVDPCSGDRIISGDLAKIIRSIMFTCGMYEKSGEFAIEVGIPAKSGVGGGIMAPAKNLLGLGVYGPALDNTGTSVVGMNILKDLSLKLNLHML